MPKGRFAKNIVGNRYGRLVVIQNMGHDNKKFAIWKCQCDCGNVSVVRGADLRNGHTRSCGCLQSDVNREKRTKHGRSTSKLYSIWSSMKCRCNNPSDPRFDHYGGRGISVCDEWNDSFEAFQIWAFSHGYEEGYSIHRINNDGNYRPENCKWLSISDHSSLHHEKRRKNKKEEK